MPSILHRLLAIFMFCAAALSVAHAATQSESEAAWQAADKAAKRGPTDIPFTDQAILHLPDGMAYVPTSEAATLMRLWGNSVGESFQGFVVSSNPQDNWVVTINQVKEGFVKDEEAKNWNPDDMLQSIKDGTEAQNEERLKMGIPALDIVGWVEPPNYDSASHRLIWSLKGVDRSAPADQEATINYNTYALGRDGYYEINLLTGSNHVDQQKPIARSLLNGFAYNQGKRYEDFDASTDHIAEYGIAALIGGVAAKKLGLLALAGVFFAKFAKLILIGFAVVAGGIFKLFRGNKTPTA